MAKIYRRMLENVRLYVYVTILLGVNAKSTCNKELVNNSKVVKGLTPPLQNDYYKNKVSEIFALSPDNIKNT